MGLTTTFSSFASIRVVNLFLKAFFISSFLVISCNSFAANDDHGPEVLVNWNKLLFEIATAEDKLLTLKGLRTATMMHVAIHDSINAIESKYQIFGEQVEASEGEPITEAAMAAYTVLVSQYPDKQELLQKELDNWITAGTGNSANKTSLGETVAKATIRSRGDDGWNTEVEYQWRDMAPGVYAEFHEHSGTPEGFVFGPGWAKARPWVLKSADQFRSAPPPALNSRAYTRAFDEVKAVGARQSELRSDDQAHLALWWKDFAENSHNRLARDIVVKEGLDLWGASRLFALLNMSIYDGYISSLENKFHFNHWRPYTAIRWADNDTNRETVQDAEWNNLHQHTYPYPSYPSAHATVCASAMSIFGYILGDQTPFSMVTESVAAAGPFSDEVVMKPATRNFQSFSEAARECADSRVYLGIHFRYDSDEGNKLGLQIGSTVYSNVMRPVSTP